MKASTVTNGHKGRAQRSYEGLTRVDLPHPLGLEQVLRRSGLRRQHREREPQEAKQAVHPGGEVSAATHAR